jgi:hypothetical protein
LKLVASKPFRAATWSSYKRHCHKTSFILCTDRDFFIVEASAFHHSSNCCANAGSPASTTLTLLSASSFSRIFRNWSKARALRGITSVVAMGTGAAALFCAGAGKAAAAGFSALNAEMANAYNNKTTNDPHSISRSRMGALPLLALFCIGQFRRKGRGSGVE